MSWVLASLLAATPALAAPAPLASAPGRGVILPPCEVEATAACWQDAPSFRRFAVPEGVSSTDPSRMVRAGDVRLAWTAEGVLVHAIDLPDTARAELSAGVNAAAVTVTRGQTALLPVNTSDPDPLALWLNLVEPDGAGALALPAAAVGVGDHARPLLAVFAVNRAPPPELILSRVGTGLRIQAQGAALTLTLDEEPISKWNRGVPPTWSTTGTEVLEVPEVPEAGWYELQALVRDADGRARSIELRRLWLEVPPFQAHLQGLHPVPAWSTARTGRPWRASRGADICAPPQFAAPAALLAEELTRFTGEPAAVLAPGGACAIQLSTDPPALPDPALAHWRAPEGFAIDVSSGRATVFVHDLRGATWASLALADLVGLDGEISPIQLADSPAIQSRVLFHRLNLRGLREFDVGDWKEFLRRVVARGRYNLVVLTPQESLAYESHPEVSNASALSADDLAGMIGAARELGIDLAPGANAPGHGGWVTEAFPGMTEDVSTTQLCTRHPDFKPILSDLYTELLARFDQPAAFHIGHDEMLWNSDRWFGDERCPRCAGTPRSELVREELEWHVAWMAERGVESLAWMDTFLQGWNGGRDGVWQTLAALSPETRAHLTMVTWADLGDPIDRAEEAGLRVMRVHTGYLDWKRVGLVELAPRLAGEGLGIWVTEPWQAFGPPTGGRALYYHWGSVVLAGSTAWRPQQVEVRILPWLDALQNLPATLPGYRGTHTNQTPVGIDAPRADLLGAPTDVSGVRFHPGGGARVGQQPVQLQTAAPGVALLQAVQIDHATLLGLMGNDRETGARKRVVAEIRATYADGSTATHPLYYGVETYRAAGSPRAALLWGTSGAVRVASPEARRAGLQARDWTYHRLDWQDPHPDRQRVSLELVAMRPGVHLLVAAATELGP